ncbi:serine/threonine-protein phosphatase 2A 55 kDa regulatory subunit B delta isoform [Silurus meridionalis]|nr:serine/threonine-protein phosphatase 2A 55 kDa regulatory subunit B delta isoform [Silurus meridionalis]
MAGVGGGNDFQWCFSQVKGAVDEDVAEGLGEKTTCNE